MAYVQPCPCIAFGAHGVVAVTASIVRKRPKKIRRSDITDRSSRGHP